MNTAKRLLYARSPLTANRCRLSSANEKPVSGTTLSINTPFVLEKLTNRSLIRLKGDLVKDFLQGLITNDINHLSADAPTATNAGANSLYSMFLSKNGRILYDSIIYKPNANEETYLIECDKEIDVDLQKHLKMFRVRKKIEIDVIGRENSVWVAFNPDSYTFIDGQLPNDTSSNLDNIKTPENIIVCNDPRLKYLGTRIIAPSDTNISTELTHKFVESENDQYQVHRYCLGIGEGIDELPVGKCFPLESNCDYLHGVSFHKGCYLGQEFTARTHHTGVVRKRLMPIRFCPDSGRLTAKSSKNVETTHGAIVGKVRGHSGDWGLGLLKFDTALKETSPLVFGNPEADTVTGKTMRPHWWPQEAPKLREKI